MVAAISGCSASSTALHMRMSVKSTLPSVSFSFSYCAMTAATWDGVAPLTERGPATSG